MKDIYESAWFHAEHGKEFDTDKLLELLAYVGGLRTSLNVMILRLEAHQYGTTHWYGCEEAHPDCAAVKQAREAMTSVL